MASEKEVLDVIDMLLDSYPHYKPRNVETLIDTWVRKFGEWEAGVLRKAADMHLDRSKFFPSVHELKELEYHATEDAAAETIPSIEDYWNAQPEEVKQFWCEMMEADGRRMVKPGIWSPVGV